MAVDDALRIAGRAARVTHARRTVFVVDGELDRVGRGQAAPRSRAVRGRCRSAGMSPLPSSIITRCFSRSNVGSSGASSAEQRPIDEDHLVVGVVDDVGELLGEQPDVERVQHSAGARRGEVQLEVAGGVPRERGDTTVGRDAEVVEHAAELAGPRRPLAVGRPLAPGPGRRDDALVRVVLLGPLEDVRDRRAARLASGLAWRRTYLSAPPPDPPEPIPWAPVTDRAAIDADDAPHVRPAWAPLTLDRVRRARDLHEHRERRVGPLGEHEPRGVAAALVAQPVPGTHVGVRGVACGPTWSSASCASVSRSSCAT